MHFEQYYTGQLYDGMAYQEFINHKIFNGNLHFLKDQTIGENAEGIEIKLDKRKKDTGNFYIETTERRDPGQTYNPAGIFRGDNTWLWCIGDYSTVCIVKKEVLVYECISKKWPIIENSYETSMGFLLPEKRMEQIRAVKIWPDRMDDELRNKLNECFI